MSVCKRAREKERERERRCINPGIRQQQHQQQAGLRHLLFPIFITARPSSFIRDPVGRKRTREDTGRTRRPQPLFAKDYFFLDGLVLDKPGAENTDTSVRLSTSWPSLLFFFLHPHCIGNYAAMGTLGVSRGAPLLFLWMIALLFLFMWDLDAQAAVETKPFYIWQTGMPLVILCKVGVFSRC